MKPLDKLLDKEIDNNLKFDFSKIINQLNKLKTNKNNKILEYLINILNSNYFELKMNKNKILKNPNSDLFRGLEALDIRSPQVDIILEFIESSENFVLPKTKSKYISIEKKYPHIVELVNSIKESFIYENRKGPSDSERIFNQVLTVIKALQVYGLVKLDNKSNTIKLKYDWMTTKREFAKSCFDRTFLKRLEEIKTKKFKTRNFAPVRFNTLDIIFFLMNENISYEEYEAQYKSLDMFSDICIFNLFKNNEIFNKFFTVFNNLLFMFDDVLVERNTAQCHITVSEDAFSILSVGSSKYRDPIRIQYEIKKSKELFLKSNIPDSIEVHHIIEWNFISKNKDMIISQKDIDKAIKELELDQKAKDKYLSGIKTVRDLIDNKYNLIPILKDVHKDINKKSSYDPIRKLSGIELNLFTELELKDNKLYLKHIFNPNNKILIEDLNKRNSLLNKENIQDLLIYNKILNKILKIDEERYKQIYNNINNIKIINPKKKLASSNNKSEKKLKIGFGY